MCDGVICINNFEWIVQCLHLFVLIENGRISILFVHRYLLNCQLRIKNNQNYILIKNQKIVIFIIMSLWLLVSKWICLLICGRTVRSIDAIAKNSQNENRIDDVVKHKPNLMFDNKIANV